VSHPRTDGAGGEPDVTPPFAAIACRTPTDRDHSQAPPGSARSPLDASRNRTVIQRVTGQPWEMVYDGFWNTVYAKHLHDTQGWQPWTCRHAA